MPGRPAPDIVANKDGTVSFQYKPTSTGVHELSVNYNESQVEGTPFRCVVDSVGKGYLTAYGEGLSYGASGNDCKFTIVGGGSDLDIKITGPGKADIKSKESKNGVTNVVFCPTSPGEYAVAMTVKGKHVHGSPFSCKVSGEGRKRSQYSTTATSEVSLKATGLDLANIKSTLKLPSGVTEPCLLKKLNGGEIAITGFSPKKQGVYQVEVTQDGKAAKGSPFKLDVRDHQVCIPTRVKTTGNATKEAKANRSNEFDIDISQAGYGALSVSVEGPHRSDIQVKNTSPGNYHVDYQPHEPGIYLLNIRFGDDHIANSPFMISVGGEASGRIRESISRNITEVEPAGIDSKCEFQLKIPGTDPLDMEATLTAPTGKSELCEISDLPDSLYDIKFVPWAEGIHTVSLKHKGLHISGSPFQYTVGRLPTDSLPHKVEIGGPGLEQGEAHAKNEFNIYTREAGAGKLTISVEGSSKAVMQVDDRGNGYTTVSYVVTKPGNYGIHVKYNDEHVPDSPSIVYVAPDSAEAKLATVHGFKDRGLEIGKPVSFHLNLNGGRGDVHSSVSTPNGEEEDVFCQELDRDMYALRFQPRENGIYYVAVKLNECHIPGSPFPMLVGKLGADPALVLAKGDGLETATSGKAASFVVVTANAGVGTLTVGIEGTSRCAIVCQEVEEGYEFNYTPMAPGDYLLNIKYSNVTIAGCPTLVKVKGTGKPSEVAETSSLAVETVEKKPGEKKTKRFVGDAKKIVAKGNGLTKCFANRPATFNVDVKDAGQGMLIVAMITPTGLPIDEISFKKQAGRATIFVVSYKTKEKGSHQLVVRWSNDDIPGSPFTLNVS